MPEIVSNFVQVHVARQKDKKFEFLSLKRAENLDVYPNLWQVITGTIEKNETAVQTAIREIFEETGLKVLRLWAIPIITSFYSFKKDRIHLSPVFGAIVDEIVEVKLSLEHQEYKWLNLDAHIELIELKSHKEASRLFFDEILNNNKCVIQEINFNGSINVDFK